MCVLLKRRAGVTAKDKNSQLEHQRAQKNWDTLQQLMTVELPEIVCIQNYRAHNYDHPYTIDLGLPKDENIPDGELWVCNYSRISSQASLSPSFLKA